MSPSHDCCLARSCIGRPSPTTCSLMRIRGSVTRASSRSSRARRSRSGSGRRSSSPSRSRSNSDESHARRAALSRRGDRCLQVDAALQILEAAGVAGLVERDDLAVEQQGRAEDARSRRAARRRSRETAASSRCRAATSSCTTRGDDERRPGRGCRRISARRRGPAIRAARRRGGEHRPHRCRVVRPRRHAARFRRALAARADSSEVCRCVLADFAFAVARGRPRLAATARSRSIRSTTSACCGSMVLDQLGLPCPSAWP